jgi:3-dehydroquinate dehydratase II
MSATESSHMERKKILVLHGPNLSCLGSREPGIYGSMTLAEIDRRLQEMAEEHGWIICTLQSNHEGVLIDALEQQASDCSAVIFNPGGLTHTSVSIRDAIAACPVPVIEVHLSNTQAREEFRRISLVSPVCLGTIAGFGAYSYLLALWYILSRGSSPKPDPGCLPDT